jgi:hypothetical protein
MRAVSGVLTVVLSVVLPAGLLVAVTAALGSPAYMWAVLLGIVMFAYGIVAAWMGSYDLGSPMGWLMLLVDLTWSLPNTVFGALTGLWLYAIFGNPSSANSAGRGWITYSPRSTTGFGNDVLQTLGTINIGGSGQHERMHLLQARIFGPLYLPLFGVFYVITFLIQCLFSLILGLALKAAGIRTSAHLNPPSRSAVSGFFGWIYFATPFEVWAYASGNP